MTVVRLHWKKVGGGCIFCGDISRLPGVWLRGGDSRRPPPLFVPGERKWHLSSCLSSPSKMWTLESWRERLFSSRCRWTAQSCTKVLDLLCWTKCLCRSRLVSPSTILAVFSTSPTASSAPAPSRSDFQVDNLTKTWQRHVCQQQRVKIECKVTLFESLLRLHCYVTTWVTSSSFSEWRTRRSCWRFCSLVGLSALVSRVLQLLFIIFCSVLNVTVYVTILTWSPLEKTMFDLNRTNLMTSNNNNMSPVFLRFRYQFFSSVSLSRSWKTNRAATKTNKKA